MLGKEIVEVNPQNFGYGTCTLESGDTLRDVRVSRTRTIFIFRKRGVPFGRKCSMPNGSLICLCIISLSQTSRNAFQSVTATGYWTLNPRAAVGITRITHFLEMKSLSSFGINPFDSYTTRCSNGAGREYYNFHLRHISGPWKNADITKCCNQMTTSPLCCWSAFETTSSTRWLNWRPREPLKRKGFTLISRVKRIHFFSMRNGDELKLIEPLNESAASQEKRKDLAVGTMTPVPNAEHWRIFRIAHPSSQGCRTRSIQAVGKELNRESNDKP
jgi:hypothetical protein